LPVESGDDEIPREDSVMLITIKNLRSTGGIFPSKISGVGAIFRAPQGGNLTNNIEQKKYTRTFAPPPRREFNKWNYVKTHTRTSTAVVPAEAGSIGSTVSVGWKEETAVFVCDRTRVERTALGIAGGQNEVAEAV
jgi:hypothetical protein